MQELNNITLTSIEVAGMVNKGHKNLIRDIRTYVRELGELKIEPTEFFNESSYMSEQNKQLPCFNITKNGCEFIAHKMTGIKGTEFTARYILLFREMENNKVYPLNPVIAASVADLGRVTERIMRNQGSMPYKIAEVFKLQCEQFGIRLPDDFVKVPECVQHNFLDMIS